MNNKKSACVHSRTAAIIPCSAVIRSSRGEKKGDTQIASPKGDDMKDSTLVFLHPATLRGHRRSERFSNQAWIPVAEMHDLFHLENLSKENLDYIQEKIWIQGSCDYLMVVKTLSSWTDYRGVAFSICHPECWPTPHDESSWFLPWRFSTTREGPDIRDQVLSWPSVVLLRVFEEMVTWFLGKVVQLKMTQEEYCPSASIARNAEALSIICCQ